jgi:hypothetical protein
MIVQARAAISVHERLSPAIAGELFVRYVISLLPFPPITAIALLAALTTIVLLRIRAGLASEVPARPLAIGLLTIALISMLGWRSKSYLQPFAPLLIACGTAYAAEASLCFTSARKLFTAIALIIVPAATFLIALVALPRDALLLTASFSGIPAAVAAAKIAPDPSFYVVMPDYIASTFAYYDRLYGTPLLRFDAFARDGHPEFFRFSDDYVKIWNSENLVAHSERRYLRDALGKRFLVLVAHSDLNPDRAYG